jgi:aspartate kinase
MKRQVWKFGGASVKDVQGLKNACQLIADHRPEELLVVVSAMGKTTSKLERIAWKLWSAEDATEEIGELLDFHRSTADHFDPNYPARLELEADLKAFQSHCKGEVPVSEYDRFYDSIVHWGERWSTWMLQLACESEGLSSKRLLALDIVRTDDRFREARVHWDQTRENLLDSLNWQDHSIYILQGFIGSSPEDDPVTLGLEGSDYSAAIYACCSAAAQVCLWKDVGGIFNADPKSYPKARALSQIDYREILDMANYGAKVVHPKTIKPLENAGIPIWVRSFVDTELEGTRIDNFPQISYPAMRVDLKGLLFIDLRLADLSYMREDQVARVWQILAKHRAKPYMTRIALMTLKLALQVETRNQEALLEALCEHFEVEYADEMIMHTLRHARLEDMQGFGARWRVFLEERSRSTIRLLYRLED